MSTTTQTTVSQVYQVFIKATPEEIWEAITKPEFTERYFYGARIENTPKAPRARPGRKRLGDADVSNTTRRAGSCTAGSRSTTRSWPRGAEPRHLGDRGRGRRLLQADGDARPARGRTEDRRERGGRGWMMVLSGLKTLLETGQPLAY